MKSEFLEAGAVVGTHGVRGELRVQPWCDSAEFLKGFSTLYWKDGSPVKIRAARVHKSLLLLTLSGVETVEQGDALRGRVLYFAREDVKLPKGSYFRQDLLGLEVLDAETGRRYGLVTDIFETGANDVYEVTGEDGKASLLPAVKEMVDKVDLENGKLLVRPIGGIFDAD